MNKYENGRLIIYSDIEIRKLREENNDIDLLIPLDLRTLNLHINNMPKYIEDRFQFNEVRNIIIRFTTNKDDNICTIHLLNSIDIHSGIVNFTMNYDRHCIRIINSDFSVEIFLEELKGLDLWN